MSAFSLSYGAAIFTIFFITTTSGAVTPTQVPKITYNCNTNKEITSIDVDENQKANIRVYYDSGFCTLAAGGGLLDCIKKAQGTDKKVVHLVYEMETQKEIIGGKSLIYFELTCVEKSINKTATVHINSIAIPATPSFTTIDLDGNSGTPNLSISKSTGITIGTELTMTLSITGKYVLRPDTCTAKPSVNTENPVTHVMWKRCDKKETDLSLVEKQDWNIADDQATLSLKVYAFKFETSDTVIIECDTMVCPLERKTEDCLLTCPVITTTTDKTTPATTKGPPTAPPGRKRRSFIIQDGPGNTSRVKSARTSFRITSEYDSKASGSNGLFTERIVYCVAVIVTKLATGRF